MPSPCQHLRAVVFDWAGTTIDFGSRAPTAVFQEIFRRQGIEVTEAEAREPMGRAKRDHIAAVAAMPGIAEAWESRFGRPCEEADIDGMYEQFLPLQKETLKEHSRLIPGAAEAVDRCRAMRLKIGSTTGYTRELMEVVGADAAEQGYVPDCVLTADDAPRGRPAPYLLFEVAKRLDRYPMWTFVKVDDTPIGIEAGRNAGCWTVGVTRTGNGVGLSEAELAETDEGEVRERCQEAGRRLTAAGAHFLVESVAEVPELVERIDGMFGRGERPF